jgi:hypothetical protein
LERVKANNKVQIEQQIDDKIEQIKSSEIIDVNSSLEKWSTIAAKKKPPMSQQIIVNAALNESKEREKRKKNVIFFGVKESNKQTPADKQAEDKSVVENIIKEVGSNAKIIFIKRYKGKDSKPGALLV